MPYELVALEAALAAGCKALDVELVEIEGKVGASLEVLAQRVDRKELEVIWHLKSVLNRVIARGTKLKQVHLSASGHFA